MVGVTWGDFGGSASFTPNAFAARYELAPATFCTSKASLLEGCIPTLVGPSPSVSKSGGNYVCTAGPVPGGPGRAGVLLATTSGVLVTPLNTPYGDLCLNQQALLAAWPSTPGGASGSCSGSYSFDLHAAVAATSAIPVGATLHLQVWYRDQGFAPPGNANYTHGIGPITVYP